MKSIIIISNSFGHKKVLDRAMSAIHAGLDVHLICYDKSDTANIREILEENCKSIEKVGSPANGGSLTRILNWFRIRAVIKRKIKAHGIPDIILVNSAELLVFASLLLPGKLRRIYDLADIHRIQYSDSLLSHVFRFVESLALKKGWEIVVTSPWFYWEYIVKKLKCNNEAFLIENKLSPQEAIPLSRSVNLKPRDENRTISIAWTGILRCKTSLAILLNLTKCHPGKYSIHLIGSTYLLDSKILEEAKFNSDIVFKGTYHPNELATHLENIDYMWIGDFDDGLNSKLLLPNRLYQAIAIAIPTIAPSATAMANVIEQLSIGFTIDETTPSGINEKIQSISKGRYRDYQNNAIKLAEKVIRKTEFSEFFLSSNNIPALPLQEEEIFKME